jgi:hypothetical protein
MSSPYPTTWTPPQTFTDLSAFSVTHFAAGKQNLAIVTGTASASTSFPTPNNPSDALLAPLSAPAPVVGSMLQLLYPAGSVNPGNRPQGGAEFYAAPLNLARASNITLEYDVFFPADFDFVRGGKLPGLFGGHETCSGGDDALDCFSTRLMWRSGGKGELYLVRFSLPLFFQPS